LIDLGIPDQMITTNLFPIHEEVEVCAEGAPRDQGKKEESVRNPAPKKEAPKK